VVQQRGRSVAVLAVSERCRVQKSNFTLYSLHSGSGLERHRVRTLWTSDNQTAVTWALGCLSDKFLLWNDIWKMVYTTSPVFMLDLSYLSTTY
jgi:hypothetical protein